MTTIDENTKTELVREIATTLAKKQRLAFASDFHAFAEGEHCPGRSFFRELSERAKYKEKRW